MEGGDNNNNNNQNNGQQYQYDANAYYGSYYVGPYCATDGKSIHLGVFKDEGCSVQAEDSIYASKNYGVALPFSASSGDALVDTSDCISCKVDEPENNNQTSNLFDPKVNEVCQLSYERAARCEANMDIPYRDTSACETIHTILPRFEDASQPNGVKCQENGTISQGNDTISQENGVSSRENDLSKNSGKGATTSATIFTFLAAVMVAMT